MMRVLRSIRAFCEARICVRVWHHETTLDPELIVLVRFGCGTSAALAWLSDRLVMIACINQSSVMIHREGFHHILEKGKKS